MKRPFRIVFIAVLSALTFMPFTAQARARGNPQLRAAAKRQKKAMKKYRKAQRKAQRKMIKNARQRRYSRG